ncbi:DUF4145 domain-containing protein [Streptomyces sp. CA-251247]|uniref:DUF4145 domain-containing protein n=1 Tax=Streptomyces sp. CA-251247 TaxID=3240062 RepID=UPI003D9159F4
MFTNLDGFDPELNRRSIAGECANCMRHTTLQTKLHSKLDGTGVKVGEKQTVRFLLQLTCDWCNNDCAFIRRVEIGNRQTTGGLREEYRTISLERVWPKQTPRELAPEAPDIVREVFAEAALAEAAGALRLAGIGYRATVEQIVKYQGAAGSNLNQRILALSGMGVPQDVVDAFHEARFVGNDAAHDALAYDDEEIADIAELIHEAVLVLYVQPAQRAKMATQRATRRATAKRAP